MSMSKGVSCKDHATVPPKMFEGVPLKKSSVRGWYADSADALRLRANAFALIVRSWFLVNDLLDEVMYNHSTALQIIRRQIISIYLKILHYLNKKN